MRDVILSTIEPLDGDLVPLAGPRWAMLAGALRRLAAMLAALLA